MPGLVLLIFYGSILFSLVFTTATVVKNIRAPMHLRWELYRGGSIYEILDGNVGYTGLPLLKKIRSMACDILYLREFYKNNRNFWYCLYLFHAGIYLLFTWHLWLFVAPMVLGVANAARVSLVWAHTGTAMVFLGSLSILVMRLFNPELRRDYPRLHYFKWAFIIVTLLTGFYAVYFYFGNDPGKLMDYVKMQVSFQNLEHKLNPPLPSSLHVLVISLWLIYLPFSHLMKLFFRYFHELRWDNVPYIRGKSVAKNSDRLLNLPVNWAAGHIQTGKTWGQVARELQVNSEK